MGAALAALCATAFAGEQVDVARLRAQQFDQAAAAMLSQAIANDSVLADDSFLAGVHARVFDVAADLSTTRVAREASGPVALGKGLFAIPDTRGEGWVGAIRPVDRVQAGDAQTAEWVHSVRPVEVVRVGTAAPVPEPSTWALLAAGLAVCALRLRGRKPAQRVPTGALPAQ